MLQEIEDQERKVRECKEAEKQRAMEQPQAEIPKQVSELHKHIFSPLVHINKLDKLNKMYPKNYLSCMYICEYIP